MKSRRTFAIVTLGLFLAGPLPAPNTAAVAPAAAALTLGAFFQQLRQTIKTLEQSASQLLAQGNVVAANQQMLLAGLLRGTLEQMERSYANALDKTAGQLAVAEKNAVEDLQRVLAEVRDLTNRSAPALIYQTQQAANQILSVLPFTKQYPVYYGLLTRDLTAQPESATFDLEFLGFNLKDRILQRDPEVKVDGESIPPPLVAVLHDRVQVRLPDALRDRLQLRNEPCLPRRPFPVELTVYYRQPNRVLPDTWFPSQRRVPLYGQALPSGRGIEIKASLSGTRVQPVEEARPINPPASGQVNVGCEGSANASASFQLPEGAYEVVPTCRWTNTSNLSHQECAAAVTGSQVTATGLVRGLNKTWLGDCPGGGHGQLELQGSFKIRVTQSQAVENESAGATILTARTPVRLSLPSEPTLVLSRVHLDFAHEKCAQNHDEVALNAPENPNLAVTQNVTDGPLRSDAAPAGDRSAGALGFGAPRKTRLWSSGAHVLSAWSARPRPRPRRRPCAGPPGRPARPRTRPGPGRR